MKKLILSTVLIFLSNPASAFFMFEPGIGYNRGHYQTSKLQGIGLTTKLGGEFDSFFLAADVAYHDLQLGGTPTSTETDLGLAIGGDFKSWRFWFTYLASSTLKIESGGTTTELTGDGIKLGISGRLSNKAYLNMEVRFIDITESNGAATSQFIDATLLSVSWRLL